MLTAKLGQIKRMEALIAKGVDVNASNPRGGVPLMFADRHAEHLTATACNKHAM